MFWTTDLHPAKPIQEQVYAALDLNHEHDHLRSSAHQILRECLPFVYMPITQPAHEQFLCDWSITPRTALNRHRAIFIGSMMPLQNPMLSNEVVERHVK
jgi:hypothetical protein